MAQKTDQKEDGPLTAEQREILARRGEADAGKPRCQCPETPDFWDKRFAGGVTPWDAGGVPEELAAFIAGESPRETLIPGCGSAWEAAFLAEAGWPVTAIDFSPQAIGRAQLLLAQTKARLVEADFFHWRPTCRPQLIYERAFLCALPRKLWPAWAARLADLLPAGGLLAGYFYFSDHLQGPPFGLRSEQQKGLLGGLFECIEDHPSQSPLAVFAQGERWQIWRRTDQPAALALLRQTAFRAPAPTAGD